MPNDDELRNDAEHAIAAMKLAILRARKLNRNKLADDLTQIRDAWTRALAHHVEQARKERVA